MTKDEALKSGFAGYNNCPHYCIDLPKGFSTVSVRTQNGKKITFAFCPYGESENPRCVDIQQHDTELYVNNGNCDIPAQTVSVKGPGPLLYQTDPRIARKEDCATLIVLSLGE